MEAISEDLLSAVGERYGLSGRATPLAPGVSGSSLWTLDSVPPVVVRVTRYHELAEVRQTCRLAAELSKIVSEAVPPLVGSNGERAFLCDGLPVTVWPFVVGEHLDRDDPAQLRQAGHLLARLHRAATIFPGTGDGYIPGRDNAEAAAQLLPDTDLDEWLRSWHGAGPAGWMHGDFFWRNILCRHGKIVGLIDWDEAWWGPLVVELAWSVWEFGKSALGDALLPDRATEFLTAYQQSGGPVVPSSVLIPIIRERLRRGIAFFRRIAGKGFTIDPVDERAQFAAFESLAHVSLTEEREFRRLRP